MQLCFIVYLFVFQCPAQNLARFPQFCTRATVKLLVGCYEVPTLGTGVNHCAEAVSIRLNSGIPAGWIPQGTRSNWGKDFLTDTWKHESISILYATTQKAEFDVEWPESETQGCSKATKVVSYIPQRRGFWVNTENQWVYMGWNPHSLMPSLGSNRISNFRTCVNHRWVADNVGFHIGLLTSTESQSSQSIKHQYIVMLAPLLNKEGKLILLMLNGSKATPSSFPSTSQLAPHPHSLPHNTHTEAIWQVQAKAAQLQLTTGASRLQHMTAYDYLNISRWSCLRVAARFQQMPPWRKNW